MDIRIERKADLIRYINLVLGPCLKDPVDKQNLKFDIIEWKDADKDLIKYISDNVDLENDDVNRREHFIAFFVLKRVDLNKIVSKITTYIVGIDKISYGMHSFTEKEFEGRKYNQILL